MLAVLPILALTPGLSSAGQPPEFPDDQMRQQLQQAEHLARKGTEELLRSIELLESAIPTYGLPYVDGNGNIVIPRHHDPAPVPDTIPDRT
ncbi:MAG TPA: hypothetical protein VL993_02290 [Stellaceae bacterium]|nr:hypothetical protein [Stellaceae bacterium]